MPYPSRTVPEVRGLGGGGDVGTSREHAGPLQGAGAGNQQRVWMLATEMGEKGGKSESACGIRLSPGSPGLVARESKLFGVLPSRVTFGRVSLRGSWAFLQGRIQNKRFERLGLGGRWSALGCTLANPLLPGDDVGRYVR